MNDIDISLIKEKAAGCQAAQMALLEKFCAIDCGSGDLAGNKTVVALVDQQLEAIPGIRITHFEDPTYGTAVVAVLGPDRPDGRIILNSHLDTVFKPGDCAAHPFRRDGDKAYGLGIADCKGGFAVSAYAVRLLLDLDWKPTRQIVMIYNPDEEVGSPFGEQVFAAQAAGAQAALVFEPARDDDGIITSRKAAMRLTIRVTGRSAHSGVSYQAGRSAVVQLAHSIVSLYEHNDPARNIFFNPVTLDGGGRGLGVVPDEASVQVSVRIADESEVDYVKQVLDAVSRDIYVPDTTVECHITHVGTPMRRTAANLRLFTLAQDLGRQIGLTISEQTTGGGSDASFFSGMGIPSIDALGPHMYAMHSFDEALRVSSLPERTALAAALLAHIA